MAGVAVGVGVRGGGRGEGGFVEGFFGEEDWVWEEVGEAGRAVAEVVAEGGLEEEGELGGWGVAGEAGVFMGWC